MRFVYKETTSFEKRKADVEQVREKYPNKVPMVIEQLDTGISTNGSSNGQFTGRRWMVPFDMTASQLTCLVRKRFEIQPTEAVFLMVNKTMPSSSVCLGELHSEYKDEDGYLYITYGFENTFGGSESHHHLRHAMQ